MKSVPGKKTTRVQQRKPRTSLNRRKKNTPKTALLIRHTIGVLVVSKLAVVLLLVLFVVPLVAFEAHVVNVTATIERRPIQCDARSIGYWANHEGCSQGEGFSDWMAELNDLSLGFSGIFSSYDGSRICQDLWIPNCNDVPSVLDGTYCKSRAHVLADELNVISGKLDPNAILAGADDEFPSFDNLGLSSSSTIFEALTVLESVLADSSSTYYPLTDVGYIAERIYTFYEEENPDYPACIYGDLEPVVASSSMLMASDGDDSSSSNIELLEADLFGVFSPDGDNPGNNELGDDAAGNRDGNDGEEVNEDINVVEEPDIPASTSTVFDGIINDVKLKLGLGSDNSSTTDSEEADDESQETLVAEQLLDDSSSSTEPNNEVGNLEEEILQDDVSDPEDSSYIDEPELNSFGEISDPENSGEPLGVAGEQTDSIDLDDGSQNSNNDSSDDDQEGDGGSELPEA